MIRLLAAETYIDRLIQFAPEMTQSLVDTGIMMGFAMASAILLGLPLGTILFLTSEPIPEHNQL